MKRFIAAVALLCLGTLTGCLGVVKGSGADVGSGPDRLSYVDVLYGTDRSPGANAGDFSDGRNERLTLGSARITIPPNHTPGIVERPATIIVFRLREDNLRHLALADDPKILTRADFIREAKKAPKGALLFVHGYNTDFDGGLYRTAQLAHDLNFKGYAFHYSWPSRGSTVAYDYDFDSERQAEPYFLEFLKILLREAQVREVTIIVHSKGSDMVLSALSTIQSSAQPLNRRSLEQLILASPDVDSSRARHLLTNLNGKFSRITLYANDNDIPLRFSRTKAGGVPRAGQLMADGRPILIPGVDSIDATAADMDWSGLNHNAYVFDDRLRADLQGVVAGKGPPEARTNFLRKIVDQGKVYWRLQ